MTKKKTKPESKIKLRPRVRDTEKLDLVIYAWDGMNLGEVWISLKAGNPSQDFESAKLEMDLDITLDEALRLYNELGEAIDEAKNKPEFHEWLRESKLKMDPKTLKVDYE